MLSSRPLVDFAVPGIRNLFGSSAQLLTFSTRPEVFQSIDWLLDNPDSAQTIGASAEALVRERHMSTHRVDTLVHWVRELKQAKKHGIKIAQPPAPFLINRVNLPEPVSIGW